MANGNDTYQGADYAPEADARPEYKGPIQAVETQPAAPQVPAILAGVPSLADSVAAAYMRHLTTNQPPPVSSVVAKAKADAAAAQPVEERPAAAPAPGSFGDKLAGVVADLGDAAHAHDTRGGWLSGVVNTLNARNARIENQKKESILLAKTQAETLAMHRNMHQQDVANQQAFQTANQAFVDTYKVNHDIEENVGIDDLRKRMKDDPQFAGKYYVRETNSVPMSNADGTQRLDKEGNPVTSPVYSLITRATKDGQPDDKAVSQGDAADFKKFLGVNYPVGTKLTGTQYAAMNVQLNSARNAVNILQTANEKEFSEDQMKSLYPYLTDPTIQGAISHVPGSSYAGLKQYETNADLHIAEAQKDADIAKQNKNQFAYDTAQTRISSLQEEKDKVQRFISMAVSPKQIERYEKEGDQSGKWLDKIMEDPASLAGDRASSVLPQLEEAFKNETDPGRKAKLTSAISMAKSARDNYFADMDRKARAEQAAKQGDPVAAGQQLAQGLLTLADLKTRQTTADFITKATEEARKFDPSYNPADEVNFEHIAKSPQTAQFFGSARSLLQKGGTLDQLYDLGKTIPNNSLPVLNTIQDWMDLSRGKGPLAGYAALVLGVADDYGKVMGGGTASDTARNSALHLFAAAQTQEQRADAIRGTLGGVGSQFDSRVGKNRFLQREYSDFDRSDFYKKESAPANKIPGSFNRPADLKTATGIAPDKKTGKLYWHDASGKVLREVKPGEVPSGE